MWKSSVLKSVFKGQEICDVISSCLYFAGLCGKKTCKSTPRKKGRQPHRTDDIYETWRRCYKITVQTHYARRAKSCWEEKGFKKRFPYSHRGAQCGSLQKKQRYRARAEYRIHKARYVPRTMKHVMIWLIGLYRKFISPLKPPCCRFTPTCSAYALEAFKKRGFFVGLILTVGRVFRCNPFFKGGYDPVPEKGLSNPKTQE